MNNRPTLFSASNKKKYLQDDGLNPKQQEQVAILPPGTTVIFYENKLIAKGETDKIAIKRAIKYFDDFNFPPGRLTIVTLGASNIANSPSGKNVDTLPAFRLKLN